MPGKIGLVLAGGGARGAYEAGVLSVLLPALERRGERVSIFVGTSVGALSATFLSAVGPERSAAALADEALTRWRAVVADKVYKRPLERLPLTAVEGLGAFFGIKGVRLRSLLDNAPLTETLDAWIEWEMLHANVASGAVDAVAVIATAAQDGRSVAFVETAGAVPADGEKLRWIGTKLQTEHVRASSAIPIVFPPERITEPADAAGWYVDGGTRLNTPIKPVIDLGAERLIVIALDSVGAPDGGSDAEPTFGDAALHLLDGTLVDPLVEDARMLGTVNRLVQAGDGEYRPIPYIFIAPERRGAIGRIATEVLQRSAGPLGWLRSPETKALVRVLGGAGPSQGALLSLLLFEPTFIERLIDLGRADAQRWLDAAPAGDPWHLDTLATRPR